MKFAKAAAVLLAVSTTAQAQESNWGYFQDETETKGVRLLQAGVVAENGAQLILKCEEPGETKVIAVVVTDVNLTGARPRPPERPVFLRFDNGGPKEVRWFYYPNSVIATNTKRNPLIGPFITQLADAKTLEVRLEPEKGSPVQLHFNVTGAREAIGRVFENCKDKNPLG
ncbi:hypothetical protein H0274_06465 [Altererythrobacter sp. CC-YST694]|uniref:hypothetical protein n=1 Tax=Altererythrobacter sp. CC-YST694 TaxID=2755038 RepID=UPI001D00F821|nr:hypothetical protein [Altererythrobacter sp. CC-YST694]MCB5424891.1 hypothetical protein [Altererythrobacter sp. CC-YST694]